MPLETASTIADLVTTNPVGASDTPAALDDHLRLIKTVLKADAMSASTVHAATTKTTPVDADSVGLVDTAASNVLKKLTWGNIKATLKSYFDTLYAASDAELTAIAGLTSSANKVPMFSGSGTATLLDFKDEDNMASDSATAVPSQQSVKAYVDSSGGLGVGQSWADVTASRSLGTTYTNSTGKPITVFHSAIGSVGGNSWYSSITVGGVMIGYYGGYGTGYNAISFIVPNGATYVISNIANTSQYKWSELS